MDAFAVAIAAGLSIERLTWRHVLRLAFFFGFFQFAMAVLGWLGGRTISVYISTYDHWIAFGLLAVIGGKMLWEAWSGKVPEGHSDPTRGWTVIMLSVATSIDALATGMSMAFIGVAIGLPSVVIGVVAAAMTVIGIRFGSRIGRKGGRLAEVLGGVVLISIGLQILISHLHA